MKTTLSVLFVIFLVSTMFIGVSQASTKAIPPQCWWYCGTFSDPCDWRVDCYCDYYWNDCQTYCYLGCP